MDNSSTFDIQLAIKRWRSALSSQGQFNQEQTDELESHLQDQLDDLKGLDISDEERFLLATHRIGSGVTLAKAFERKTSLYFRTFPLSPRP